MHFPLLSTFAPFLFIWLTLCKSSSRICGFSVYLWIMMKWDTQKSVRITSMFLVQYSCMCVVCMAVSRSKYTYNNTTFLRIYILNGLSLWSCINHTRIHKFILVLPAICEHIETVHSASDLNYKWMDQKDYPIWYTKFKKVQQSMNKSFRYIGGYPLASRSSVISFWRVQSWIIILTFSHIIYVKHLSFKVLLKYSKLSSNVGLIYTVDN